MTKLKPVTPLSIIASNLEKALISIESKDLIDAETKELLKTTRELATRLEPYLIENATPEENTLRNLAKVTLEHDWRGSDSSQMNSLEPEMLSGHVEGMFLRQIVALSNCKNILEIGLFSGYSALAMAQALPKEGRLVACEIDAHAAKFARSQFAKSDHGSKIEVIVGDASETLKTLRQDKHVFDLVFLDADKVGYKGYFEFLLENNMVKQGGIFLVDNTLLQGEPYLNEEHRSQGGEAIRLFNEYLSREPRIEQVLIPIRDGVTLARLIA
ncbi:class I SAM-dependent methyltransferase [Pseudomonadota bacterium]|nr:class I SAM-dependent methyltransferase [Pseudomonadota bacterium]